MAFAGEWEEAIASLLVAGVRTAEVGLRWELRHNLR